VELDSNSNVEK